MHLPLLQFNILIIDMIDSDGYDSPSHLGKNVLYRSQLQQAGDVPNPSNPETRLSLFFFINFNH